jgi:hypothetical protein
VPRGNRAARLRLGRKVPWYVPQALRERPGPKRRGADAARAATVVCAGALAFSACGGGTRQDENEPKGKFEVQVVRASFPEKQKLAKRSILEIAVKNVDTKKIPNIAVTLHGFDRRKPDPELADPARPVFVINGRRKSFGGIPDAQEAGPEGGQTAYVDTWTLGPMKAGETKVFQWDVTAVQAGPYRLTYSVSAGLDGKAKAVLASGDRPEGIFAGKINGEAPKTKVAEDGKTVVSE